jgi:transcriptional regulator with AAA-type ATPase domain
MDTNINRLNEEIKNVEGIDGGVGELDKVLGSNTEKISEVVGKVGENGSSQASTQQKVVKTVSLFDKISDLLFSAKTKEIVLPSQEIQRRRVEHSLKKETSKLLRKAKKIQKARHFSAHALEQVIQEIRYLQRLIAELFSFATEKLEALYKQYVLRVA